MTMFNPLTSLRAASSLLILLTTPAIAQDNAAEGPNAGELRGEVSASRVFGSNLSGIDAEEEDSGSSTVLRGSLDYELEAGFANVTFGYDTAGYFYDSDRPDRWSNRGSIRMARPVLDDVVLVAQASYASNISTAESASTDQTELLARLQFAVSSAHRVQPFAGYRWRTYDFDGSEGEGAFFGAEYRFRLGANHYITAEARREVVNSDNVRRGYDRNTAELFYQRPLTRRLRLQAGATVRWWEFDGRLAPTGESLERRSLTPEVDLLFVARSGWTLRSQLQQIVRGSNDPQLAEDETRLVLSAGYRF